MRRLHAAKFAMKVLCMGPWHKSTEVGWIDAPLLQVDISWRCQRGASKALFSIFAPNESPWSDSGDVTQLVLGFFEPKERASAVLSEELRPREGTNEGTNMMTTCVPLLRSASRQPASRESEEERERCSPKMDENSTVA